MKRLLVVLALVALLVAARDGKRPKSVDAAVAAKRAAALTTEIAWKTSLDDALAQAKTEGKLVFWVQILGDLDGAT